MPTQPENQVVAKQRETVQAAVQQLHAKLDAYQSQLTDGWRSLRDEVETLVQQMDASDDASDEARAERQSQAEDQASLTQDVKTPVDNPPANEATESVLPNVSTASTDTSVSAGDALDEILLGVELSGEAYHGDRSELIQGLYQHDESALSLVGQIMIFRGADPERRLQLLKEIGEAYYHWRGPAALGVDPFRDDLIAFLTSTCQASGMPVSVELVQVGDRFDSKRHNAKQRGVEVNAVEGWVVLGGSGKVYTRATVVLK